MDAEHQRLIEENRHLRAENAELKTTADRLKQRIEHLTNQVEKLSAALEEAHRAGKRQAAPFRKPKRRGKPKKPGRKPGDQYGEHARRTARRCAAAHEQIRQDVRGSPQVVPDETGWRVGGEKAWLHEFAGLHEVAYVVDPTRSREPAERLLGLDWSGRLVHDGWTPYDAFTRAIHQQCNAHLINRCKKLLETATAGAARFPAAVKALLLRGLALRDRSRAGKIGKRGLAVMAGRLTRELLCLVGARKFNPANERLASHLFAYHETIFNYFSVLSPSGSVMSPRRRISSRSWAASSNSSAAIAFSIF